MYFSVIVNFLDTSKWLTTETTTSYNHEAVKHDVV